MVEFLGSFFATIFGEHSIIATIIISMVPLIELKGGIPVGMSQDFWGMNALNGTQAFLFALLGSCMVVPIVALIFTPILNWLKRTKMFKKLGDMIDKKVKDHTRNIEAKTEKEKSSNKKTWIKFFGVLIFVSVPLPLTGVWTGTCVAVAIGLKFWQTCIACILGNIIAGLIIVFVCSIFPQFTTVLFLIILGIVAVLLIVGVVKYFISKKKENKKENIEN